MTRVYAKITGGSEIPPLTAHAYAVDTSRSFFLPTHLLISYLDTLNYKVNMTILHVTHLDCDAKKQKESNTFYLRSAREERLK